ncbi:ParB/RepB/Spo0J family partition protein [Vibrio coralliilyticus]|jgi:ParB family chromosome partitioning protein|uniref:ParB/RepB/Spo0J family partition protein n=1 Tax=Vibrio TaxID=662 RepID=UPI000390E6A2|nr:MULTISPECIES: ParB/RepB/Spo0J family partition protein [Vibrio]ERB65631.1 chromosome partitioning protein ParB [Vibrio coralliilyticus OCN008]KFI13072.1 chromosome partitioning protein ParB [Vibrio sp. B183]NOI17722.1 ParB/RepB/Spo0J family partition protein [Vibrio coralliilyticus]NOI27222.1 ParB/RepB/Spo0J family partition protein [Vibrio coralliilyticus]NOI46487.1 ParB/RepB/Spo0J family partition protein [Vibrio coralliilyticus]
MAIKTSDLNARLFGKANKRHVATPQEAQKAAKEQAQVIELAVAGEEMVTFELVRISASDIAEQTVVFAENAREQSFLNEHALSDVLATLKERGQQYPAVGRKREDGKIEVLDGSRRRMSCILAEKDFLIYVAENINGEHAKFLSDVANAHKPLSLYEKGKEMQAKLESGEAEDQKALAKMFQCSEALVSGALKAADLPLTLLQAYPNVADLGRPTIVKLHKQFNELSEANRGKLLDKCQSTDGFVWQRSQAQGVARITKEVSETLEQWIEELAPSKRSASRKVELVKGRASYSRKGADLALNLKKVDDALMQEILDFVSTKLK